MNDVEVVISLTTYQAEVIRLVAEKCEKTVQDIILSFFSNEVQCTQTDKKIA